MLQAMAGHDPADPASADRPVPDYRAALSGDVKGLRIGLIRHFYENDNRAEDATRQGIAAAVKVFEDLGCSVRELRLSPLADWAACGVMIMLSEAHAIHQATLRDRFGDYGEMFRDRMALAALISGGDYVQAVRRRRELAGDLLRQWPISISPSPPPPRARRRRSTLSASSRLRAPDADDAVQRHRHPGDVGVLRLQRGGFAARLPARRQAVRRGDGAAGRARLRTATPWRSVRPRLDG